jgi:hypothetical protein
MPDEDANANNSTSQKQGTPQKQGNSGVQGDSQQGKKSTPAGQLGKRDGHIFVIPPHPNTKFDDEYFLTLLEGSISLTMEEKQRVIDAIPRLGIDQINELIKIFEEEKQKFSELEKEFADDVAKLKSEREKEMQMAEVRQEESSESDAETEEAEALKRKLMGGSS